jgi:hypothetical protein
MAGHVVAADNDDEAGDGAHRDCDGVAVREPADQPACQDCEHDAEHGASDKQNKENDVWLPHAKLIGSAGVEAGIEQEGGRHTQYDAQAKSQYGHGNLE